MGSSKKRKRNEERPRIHPNNKYSENPPDFALLASLYPSFHPFVHYSREGRPRIDWCDFNATRELTRVLLHHDYALNWLFSLLEICILELCIHFTKLYHKSLCACGFFFIFYYYYYFFESFQRQTLLFSVNKLYSSESPFYAYVLKIFQMGLC